MRRPKIFTTPFRPLHTISTKLLLTNLLVCVFIVGVLAVMFFSLGESERLMSNIVHQGVPQMISNAWIGRTLAEVFADTSHLIDRFLDERELLLKEGERLIRKLETLVAETTTSPKLNLALRQFLDVFQAFLHKGVQIHEQLARLERIDQDIVLQFNNLDEFLVNTIIVTKMNGGDVQWMEQLSLQIPWYRETCLQARFRLIQLILKYLRVAPSDDTEETDAILLKLLVLLEELDARLQPLEGSEAEIRQRGVHLIDLVRTYKSELIALSQELTAFQSDLNTMDASRNQILIYLGTLDQQIGSAAETMQQQSGRVMHSSRMLAIGLAGVILLVMIVGWLSMRWMIHPLRHLSDVAEQLAEGAIDCSLDALPRATANDEIGILSRAFIKLLAYLQDMARIAAEIAQGNITLALPPRSAHDVLGQSYHKMSRYLNELADAATAIAAGQLHHPLQPKTERDVLGNAFHRMAAQLDENFHTIETQLHEIQSVSAERERLLLDLRENNRALQIEIEERTRIEEELRQHREHLEELVSARTVELTQEIADRKRAEAELQHAKEAALHALQSAEAASQAKSEFLAHMSHELRTPLNGILGYAQILQRHADLSPKQQQAVEIIERSGQHLLMMISNILDLSRIEAGKRELVCTDFYLHDVVKTVAEIGRIQAAQKGITFHVDAPAALHPVVYGDQTRLNQVLLNLIHNAITFTMQGTVTLSLAVIDPARPLSSSQRVRFQVQDTGIGIPTEQLSRIFEPFQQVKNPLIQSKGLGLGLAICQRLVRMMGADLQVQSTVGEGSIFWFDLELPPGKSLTKGIEASVRKIVKIKNSPCKVLVVDDTAENLIMLKDMLHPLGFEIVEAVNGRDGLEKAVTFQPEVILVDLFMPEMDGLEMTRQIRQNPGFQESVIIAVSANAFEHARQKSLDAGCNDFIVKPVHLESLLKCLQTHVGLEWVYDDEVETAADSPNQSDVPQGVPSPEEGDRLMEMVQKGDLMAACAHVDWLERQNAQYAAFAAQIRHLASGFYVDELEAFLVECYTKKTRNGEEECVA